MGTKYYISTYSAHASLLEQIASKKDDSIEKLYVSYGGLKVPKGSFDESVQKKIFKGLGKSSRVLHAKVILKETDLKSELWLWTGNLRKNTLRAQNALMSIPLNKDDVKDVRTWFEKFPDKNLIITINSSKELLIKSSSKSILSSLMKSIKNYPQTQRYKCSIFSPWGSTDVLKKILSIEQIQNVLLYTRYANGRLWIDYDNEKIKMRNIASEDAPFPHTKCMFLQNEKDQIVWAYIGSANFTNQGMKKTISEGANIEYALIMEGISTCKPLDSVLMSLKNGEWNIRKGGKFTLSAVDDSTQEFGDELDIENPEDNYKENRELQKECEKLISTKQEEEFDRLYYCDDTKSHPFLENPLYCYKVMGVGTFYNLLVQKDSGYWYEMSFKRTLTGPLPFNKNDAKIAVDNIYRILVGEKKDGEGPGSGKEKNGDRRNTFENLRFPYESFVGKEGEKKMAKVKKELLKLNQKYIVLTEGQKKLVDLWLPLIRQMNKKEQL